MSNVYGGQSSPPDDYDTIEEYDLEVGMDVSHPTYGRGSVIEVKRRMNKLKVVVNFFDYGQRTVNLHHLGQV